MAKYIINGGKKLVGEVTISGNKNAILPCMAACLLTSEEIVLNNVPNIADVLVLSEILQSLGVKISIDTKKQQIRLKAEKIITTDITSDLMKKLRASILLVGPMLARWGECQFIHPGGDIIGKRTIQPHLDGFCALGFKIEGDGMSFTASLGQDSRLDQYFFEEAGVTATENVILAAVLGEGTITLKNCAKEPHIVDLCNLLSQMGAKIEGIGEATLKITAVNKLSGAGFRVGADFVELGTYAIASAITAGDIKIRNAKLSDLEPITLPLQKMGVLLAEKDNKIRVRVNKIQAIPKLHTNIWPGFPTDLMSVFIILATQAEGVSLLHDWMYESRMFFVDKLISMGANITIADPHRVVVYGRTCLRSKDLETPDIRAGMALVLAALIAEGRSVINRAELIERGYQDVVKTLSKLGADITRVE